MTVPKSPLVLSGAAVARRLQASEAVIIPTDTLPGLAVLPQKAPTDF
jgi:L-threonylcarbamoyladenylate synthase